VRLYAWLALEVGGTEWERTVTFAAKALQWQPRTVTTHAEHLWNAWLVYLARQGPGASSRMRLLPQPARDTRTPSGRDGNGMDDEPLKPETMKTPAPNLRVTRAPLTKFRVSAGPNLRVRRAAPTRQTRTR
jgi:hypothetical protein